jgi:hypothetical protein
MIEQSDLDTIAQLVEEYVRNLANTTSETLEGMHGYLGLVGRQLGEAEIRLDALEHVANQAIYRDYIRNEAIRVGFYVQGHPEDEADIPND